MQSPCHVTSIEDCAALISRSTVAMVIVYIHCPLEANTTAGIDSGIVIAVPIPQHAALLGEEIERAITLTLEEAKCKALCL